MSPASDVLELLLPGAGAAELARARAVVTFARLFANDGARTTPAPAGVTLAPASVELEVAERSAALEALEDLLAHVCTSAAPSDSFAWFGAPRASYASAWAVLVEHRDELSAQAAVPAPAEPALDLARRLLDEAARLGLAPGRVDLWRARLAWLGEGARAAEAPFAALLRALDPPQIDPPLWCAALASAVEALLDEGRARRARALLDEQAGCLAWSPRLDALRAWCELLVTGEAPPVPRAAREEEGPLALPLRELRADEPRFVTGLPGREPATEGPAIGSAARARALPLERARAGAGVLALIAFAPRTGARVVHLDAAPALEDDARRGLERRAHAHEAGGEPEQRLVLEARALCLHAEDARPPRGAVASGTRALVLVPIVEEHDGLAGWIHLELEHHLVPSAGRREELAASGRAALRAPRSPRDRDAREPARAHWLDLTPELSHDAPLARAFARLVETCGAKTAHRHWFAVVSEGARARLVAEGGALAWRASEAGGATALARVLATGAAWLYEDPAPELGLVRGTASGALVPIRWRGQCIGVLAFESNRRRDFRASDLERFARAADEHALAIHLARFDAWHRERFGGGVWLDPERPRTRELAERVAAGGGTRVPVLVAGPGGAGKTTLARWLHHESPARARPLARLACGADPDLERLARAPHAGAIVLDGIERLSARGQARLVERLESRDRLEEEGESAGGGSARLVCAWTLPPDAAEPGPLAPELLARLARLRYDVPPLADRRDEIPGLARALLERAARAEGRAEPRLADDAVALLWRQPWPGNVRELEQALHRVVLIDPGAELGAEPLGAALARFGAEPLARLPSRHPRRIDLEAALAATRTAGGRANKTRAALYLGWDPDTLVARLRDAGLDGALEEGTAARDPDAPQAPPEPA